jgi:iron/zinc/copper transport system permease protein
MDASMSELFVFLKSEPLEACYWLSLFAAPLGALLIFRRLSFFGDALGHASLAGVAIAVLVAGQSPWMLSVGALIAVLLSAALLHFLEKRMRLPSDVAMTVSYSGFFALGLLLMFYTHMDLEHLLFGDLWSMDVSMMWFLRIWGCIVIVLLLLLWRPLWLSVMDPLFSRSLGFNTNLLDLFFLCLTAISVVGMIQSVGVVLVAAYFVLPASSILPWARSLRQYLIGSIIVALLSGVGGMLLSRQLQVPAGACIALTAFCILILSHGSKAILLWMKRRSMLSSR